MMEKIFVALSTFAQYGDEPLKLLQDRGLPYTLNTLGRRLNKDEIINMGRDCQGVIAGVEPYDEYVLENLPKLRCISRCGVGVDNISLGIAKKKGIEILITSDVVVQPVAELTVGMIFDLLRKITYHTILLKSKRWEKKAGNILKGKKIGILGLGRIGKRVAEIMVKLEAQVYGADLKPDKLWAEKNGVILLSNSELLRMCDIICIHPSFLKDCPFRLGEKEISLMKKGALIVNVSRGNFIDEEALYTALKNGYLAGAALDVFQQEPYSGKLCDLDNMLLTPHIATLTEESRLQMELEATKNIINFFNKA